MARDIEGGIVEPTELAHVPEKRPDAASIPTMIDALRSNPIVHYGLGVSVKRQGIGWQLYAGTPARLVCSIGDVTMVDMVARALVGFSIGEGIPPWRCPKCSGVEVDVLDSRRRSSDRVRRYKCRGCDVRWSTTERIYVPRPRGKP